MESTSGTMTDSFKERNDSTEKHFNEGNGDDVLPSQTTRSVFDGIEPGLQKSIDSTETFDDSPSPSFTVEKMVHFLRKGSESQQTVILFEIQQLLQHCFEETVEMLMPILCECIPLRSEELQLSASEVIANIIQQPISPRITKLIASMAFRIIQSTCTEDSFEAWGEILAIVLPDVKWNSDEEIQGVLRTIDDFSKKENELSRKIAARMLGSLSASLKSVESKQSVLVRALAMVDDSDVEVRGMVVESFSFIGADLEMRSTEKTLWPKLLALMHDPDARIHAACLRSMAHILEARRHEIRKSILFRRILPSVFAKECAFARKAASQDQRTVDDDSYLLLEIMAEVFGPLVHTLYPFLTEENRKDAFKAFLAMTTCNGPIVRRYCAFNFPGVALTLQNSFRAELAGIAEFLARDADSETRWNFAAGIHKTCSILMNKQSAHNLQKAVMSLLQDDNPLVRMNTLENLSEIVQVLYVSSDAEKWSSSSMNSFFQRLTLLSEENWRTQELLAKQLKQIAELVPQQCLTENILPLLYQMAEEGTHCVRKETMMAIAKTIWCIPLPEEREEVLCRFFQEWGQGGVYWMRIAFVDCAQEALKIFSNDLYSYLFLPRIYQLARDNVANVRLRVARMLHELAPFNHLDEEFQKAVTWFKEDVDPDVRSMMDDIKVKVRRELRCIRTYRKQNEVREEAETKLEEQALLGKSVPGKKAAKTKRKASMILPMIATKTGHLSPRQGRATPTPLSPVSGSSSTPSPRTSPTKLSSMLSGSNSKSKDPGKGSLENGEGGGAEAFSPKSSGRKSLMQILSVSSPRRSKRDLNNGSAGNGKHEYMGYN